MDLKSKNKVEAGFNMSSMTDVVFLLLIFFMLTATFVTPSGLPVNLPSSKSSTTVLQKVSVTISDDLRYFINGVEFAREGMERGISEALKEASDETQGIVVLHIDAAVPVEELVYVAGIATKLKAKVSIATKPDK